LTVFLATPPAKRAGFGFFTKKQFLRKSPLYLGFFVLVRNLFFHVQTWFMKDILKLMSKAFDSRVRIALMSVLLTSGDWVDFNDLKAMLGVTDGNMASHIQALENRKFIEVRKRFIEKRPNTSYRITEEGKIALNKHVNALRQLLKI